MRDLMRMLDNDEVVTIHSCPNLKALADYMDSQGIDADDYRMEKIDGAVQVWRA